LPEPPVAPRVVVDESSDEQLMTQATPTTTNPPSHRVFRIFSLAYCQGLAGFPVVSLVGASDTTKIQPTATMGEGYDAGFDTHIIGSSATSEKRLIGVCASPPNGTALDSFAAHATFGKVGRVT
jgi:hypothetical protein